jgi:hypothetical protein
MGEHMTRPIWPAAALGIAAGFVFFLVAGGASPAPGQVCAPRAAIVGQLTGSAYSERLAGRGAIAGLVAVELYVSAAGSWSLVTTRPRGPSCLILAGEGWELVAPAFGEEL